MLKEEDQTKDNAVEEDISRLLAKVSNWSN